jgi:hypothetical protein
LWDLFDQRLMPASAILGHQSVVPAMNYLYSLYDALVSISISVPSDKARAVVDAMERDMGTTLANKQDLEILKKDIDNRIALLEQQFNAGFVRLDQKIDTLDLKLTVKVGSMLFVGFGLTIAAMRLWA